jgi:hypothetical protein
MKVIGLTDELHGAAEEQCREGFRAWRVEVTNATWGNWEELEKHFPKACQVAADEAHFPLRSDGTGVRARIFFPLNLLLLCIAPAPAAMRAIRRAKLSVPHH